ncbi:hypothetical protein AZL_a09880 (plasmid) [Azospirillum sp. B510]|uniref:NHLP bacteriocin system secretion protein n=1 Tax=Azospirillum sp. (strain B510) TaxID=137722 RepID=UPI0001C4BC86|nr:NHLP bacteriocin system secretion protein [Azospirillum sp. B510]BAI74519.1 hypothetical protein AZL_a09880 [Azospirillum sp. B510]
MSVLTGGADKEKSPFRKVALDRLGSPEQLDRLVSITQPSSWVALLAVVLLLAAAVVWSIVGSIPTYVNGPGLLINSGGRIYSTLSPGSGRLGALNARIGDMVQEGQVIARIVHDDLEQQHRNAEDTVAERRHEVDRQIAFAATEVEQKTAALGRRRKALATIREAARQREQALGRKLADEEALLTERVVTRQSVLQTRQAWNQASQEVAEIANQIAQLDNEELDLRFRADQRVRDAENALGEAERRLAQIGETRRMQTDIRAPASGRVNEIQANAGALVQHGENILSIETQGNGLQLLMFADQNQGDRLKPGMEVRISPANTQREEDGTLLGVVSFVSDFPMTPEGMRAILSNAELVRSFSRSGPPFLVRVDLATDPGTASGYRWSSSRGNRIALTSGTMATADVTVRRQAPITLAIPMLRQLTGL